MTRDRLREIEEFFADGKINSGAKPLIDELIRAVKDSCPHFGNCIYTDGSERD